MKATPTPWETSVNEQEQWDVCAEDAGDMIADLANCDNGEANATFIVRAVNNHAALVEALEAVIRVADRATVEFDMARAALANAKQS